MPHLWIIYAIGAAIMWGFVYAMSEKIIKDMLPLPFFVFVEGVMGLIIATIVVYFLGTFKPGIEALQANPKIMFPIILVTLASTLGWFLILLAFEQKNATLVNMIEISYPVFHVVLCMAFIQRGAN